MGPPLLFLLVGMAQSPAPTGALSAKERLDRAHVLQEQLDYDEALLELNVLLTDTPATPEERFDAHLMAGVVARIMEKDVEARGHFLYVLQSRPDYNLPPGTSPKVQSFFELVRLEVVRPAASPGPAAPTGVGPGDGPIEIEDAPSSRDEASGWPWAAVGGGAVLVVAVVAVAGAGALGAWLLWPRLFPADEKPEVTLGRHDLSTALVLASAAIMVVGAGATRE